MVKMESCDHESNSLHHQSQKVKECGVRKLVEGDKWYVVAKSWYDKLVEYLSSPPNTRESLYPGPIDNSSIIEQDDDGHYCLKEHLVDELDYQLIPEDIYLYLEEIYGLEEDQQPIIRYVVDVGQFTGHLKVEVYLMEIIICRFDAEETFKRRFSRKEKTANLHSVARQLFNIPQRIETQLWSSISDSSYNRFNDSESTLQDEMIYPGCKVFLDIQGSDGVFASAKVVGVSEKVKKFRDTFNRSSLTKEVDKNVAIPLPAPETPSSSPPMTRGIGWFMSNASNNTPGLCGLSNLGNTCFMNSVLQCMSNTPPITDYFLNDRHHEDLNVENPLGMRGEIAKSFGELIKQMWSGTSTTVPHHFKLQVSKFAPQFSGYQQHDAQELLTFLLDGLHEDLNRIRDKPYITQKDSDGRPDEVVAAEAWSNYKKRNDSIIVDLFHGLLKSTVVCPRCNITSVTFDPSCYLSLPLPPKCDRLAEVLYVPYSADQRPILYKVQTGHRSRVEDVCQALHKLTNCPVDRMIATHVHKNHFLKIFDLTDPFDMYNEDRERLVVYQTPVSVHDKKFISLPVCQWELDPGKDYSKNQLFGVPVFVVVPRNGCTYLQLYNAILNRMAPFLNVTVPSYKNFDGDSLHHNGIVKDSDNEDDDIEEKPNNDEPMDVNVDYASGSAFGFENILEIQKNWDRDDEQKYTNGDSSKHDSFKVFIVNNHETKSLPTNAMEKVIQFPDVLARQYLVVRWTPGARQAYFNEAACRDFEKHESYHCNIRPNGVDLKDCLTLFTNMEKLDASEAWYCPKCKDHIEATKKFDLWSLPRILVIHLKRFHYSRFRRDKIDTTVHFPLRGLDLKDYIVAPNYDQSTKYDLIGVCNHYGNLAGGHYTAYGLNKVEKVWYLFDDNHVQRATESSVVSNSAYVLFYMRRDSEAMQH